jgi:hypothetical protein
MITCYHSYYLFMYPNREYENPKLALDISSSLNMQHIYNKYTKILLKQKRNKQQHKTTSIIILLRIIGPTSERWYEYPKLAWDMKSHKYTNNMYQPIEQKQKQRRQSQGKACKHHHNAHYLDYACWEKGYINIASELGIWNFFKTYNR